MVSVTKKRKDFVRRTRKRRRVGLALTRIGRMFKVKKHK
ncbi:hypothetical protein LCGC14_0476460 [marine sediment metagenome]|uniref:Uncharacterized protein n=1 Tax=marine sediment metagenome TaxID=412755 RepID=A0A0F9VJE1_9ZZZZ